MDGSNEIGPNTAFGIWFLCSTKDLRKKEERLFRQRAGLEGKWNDGSWARSEEEKASDCGLGIQQSTHSYQQVATLGRMEVDHKKDRVSAAEGAVVDAKPRWKQYQDEKSMDTHIGSRRGCHLGKKVTNLS